MMQMGLIHCRRFSICFPCSLIWFVCVFFFLLTFSFTSASSGSLTAWLDIYSSQTLIRPTWPPLVSHHYFPSLSAIFSMPALFQFFPHLLIFSAPLSLFVHHLSVFWKCSLFSFSFFFVCIAIVLQRPGQSKFSVPLTLSHWRHCLKTAMWVSNMSCEDSWMFCLTELMAHSWLTSCASLLWRVSWTLPHVNNQ